MMQRVRISRHLIAQMLTTGYTVDRKLEVMQGLSPGARLAFVDSYDEETLTLVFDVTDNGPQPDEFVDILIREVAHPEPGALPCGVL